MTIKTFEEIQSWQKARELVNCIYQFTRKPSFAKDFGLKDQIQRAAVSVMSNIAEGFERQSNLEFIKFLFIAKGSAGEVRSLLYLAKDQKYITDMEFSAAEKLTVDCSRLISKFITFLKSVPKTL